MITFSNHEISHLNYVLHPHLHSIQQLLTTTTHLAHIRSKSDVFSDRSSSCSAQWQKGHHPTNTMLNYNNFLYLRRQLANVVFWGNLHGTAKPSKPYGIIRTMITNVTIRHVILMASLHKTRWSQASNTSKAVQQSGTRVTWHTNRRNTA
jgi:hypothetical protein